MTNVRANSTTEDRRPNPPGSCTSFKITLQAPEEQQPGAAVPPAARHGAPPTDRLGVLVPDSGWGGFNPLPPGLRCRPRPRLSREGGRDRAGLRVRPPARGGLLPRGHPAAPRPGRAPRRQSATEPSPYLSPGPGPSPDSLGRWLPAAWRRRQLPASFTEPRPRRAAAGPGGGRGGERPPLAAGGRAARVPSAEPEPRPGSTYRYTAVGTATPQRRPGGPTGRSILRRPARARRLPLGAHEARR